MLGCCITIIVFYELYFPDYSWLCKLQVHISVTAASGYTDDNQSYTIMSSISIMIVIIHQHITGHYMNRSTKCFMTPNSLCRLFSHAVTASDGEDHEGVLVRQRGSQTDGPAHQEDSVSAQRGGGCQNVSPRWRRNTQPDHTPIGKQTTKKNTKDKTANENPASFKATLQVVTRPTSPF